MDNVHVAVRVRPLIQREKQAEAEAHWKADRQTITQVDHRGKACRKEYVFDRVFASSETTSDVYEEIAQPIVLNAMDGINGTIFAYGQTSSGKTYTMMGDNECPGIIPCAVQETFQYIEDTFDREFLLRVSYMELYNESLCDLLTNEKKALQIREVDRNVFVNDLTEEIVTKEEAVIQLLKKGEARRHFGQTNMNERSSRSHTIFRMIIESRLRDDRKKSMELAVKVSHLNLVDLAGSERANETKAEGARLKEACRINQSLHQLAMVINKLSQGAEFIPFRDSKLTRILQTSLGGNAKTAIICTVTPSSIDQTHGTLQFASRAKTIKNKPEVNEVLSDEAMMQRQKKEIQGLKRKIMELEQQGELLEEKASLHEQQELKIKMLEKMILVSGAAGIQSMLPSSESKKAKYKRRQTWCPGIGNRVPLLPFAKPAAPPAITEEASFISSSPPLDSRSTHMASEEVDFAASVSSDDFSSAKKLRFIEEMDDMEHIEHSHCAEESFKLPSSPPSPQFNRRKRRRAQVHFAISSASDAVDAACQTEIEAQNVPMESQENEVEALSYHTARIIELEAKVEELQDELVVLSTSGHQGSTEMPPEVSLVEENMKRHKDHITELEAHVEELQCRLAVSNAGTLQAGAETGGGLSLAEEALRHHAARVIELEALVEELQSDRALSRASGNQDRAVVPADVVLQTEEARRQNAARIEELEVMVEELQGDLALSRASGNQEGSQMAADAFLQTEETRRQNAARIEELEAMVEELQGDLALSRASGNQDGAEIAGDAFLQTEDARKQNVARIAELEALVEELKANLVLSRASSHQGKVEMETADVFFAEEGKTNKIRIFELEALVEELLVKLARTVTPGNQRSAEIAADSVLQMGKAKLETLVKELQSHLKEARVSDCHKSPNNAGEISMDEEGNVQNAERIAELEALVKEMQGQLAVSGTLADQGRAEMMANSVLQVEEIRRQHAAKIVELEALVEELQGQLALSRASRQQGEEVINETSLAEESRRLYLERIASLEVLVEELQGQIEVSRVSEGRGKAADVLLLPEEPRRHFARIVELEALVEQLQTEQVASGAQLAREENVDKARIGELEAIVDELQGQLVLARSSDQEREETKNNISQADEIRRHHEARIAELEAFVEELQAESRSRGNNATADTRFEVAVMEDTVRPYTTRIVELETLVAQLQTQQTEASTFKASSEAGDKNDASFMEKARKQSAAKVIELEAQVEELQGQLALSTASSHQEMPKIGDGVSLVDEVRRHYEARITELEALIEELQICQEAASQQSELKTKDETSLAEEARQNYEAKIAELEAVVEELQKQAPSRADVYEAKLETGNKDVVSFMEEARRSNAARIAELEALVEELQGRLAVSGAAIHQTSTEMGDVALAKETRTSHEAIIAEHETLIRELQDELTALRFSGHQGMKETGAEGISLADEMRKQDAERIAELEAHVEDLQSELALLGASDNQESADPEVGETSLDIETRRHYEARISELEVLVEKLQNQQEVIHQSRPDLGDELSLAEETKSKYEARILDLETRVEGLQETVDEETLAEEAKKHYVGRISELETLVEKLQTQQGGTQQSGLETENEVSQAEETKRRYEARIAELEAVVKDLQQITTHKFSPEIADEVSLAEKTTGHYKARIMELEELLAELQTQQIAIHQPWPETTDDVSQAEEITRHYKARVSELKAQVEELQCQLAATRDSNHQGKGEVAEKMTLADELATQGWKEKARTTESELLGSVELCEEIMEEKSRLSGQIEELQVMCTHLENALRDKSDKVQALKELNEFTQLEVTMSHEQEAQYQSDVSALKMQLRETEDTLVAKHRQEVQELQKKLGSKDKVLEAQYQQDIDELLHKLREKNQKFDALQEQNVSLDQALSQKVNLVERLQRHLEELEAKVQSVEQETRPEDMVPPVANIDKESQTVSDGEFTPPKESIFTQVSTQVTTDDLGLLIREVHTQTEVGQEQNDLEAEKFAFGKSVQERIEEFEAREAILKVECESLSETISNRDQEIEVLNELLQEFEQDDRDADDAAKIEAFVQRIEQLEQQLEDAPRSNSAMHLSPTFQESSGGHDFQGLVEENKTLSNTLVQAENNCRELMENLENMKRELGLLTEKNMLLIEDLKTAHEKYQELDAKLQESENTWQDALEHQVRDVELQKAAWYNLETELNRKIAHLEESIQVLLENSEELKQTGHSVLKEKEMLLQEQQVLKELVEEGARKIQELETALALQSSQSQTAANTLRERDNEIKMLHQVVEEQEQNLEASTQNGNADSEISRLQNILAQQGDILNAKEDERRDLVSKIQQLESVLVTYEQKIVENSEALAKQLSEIQRLQNALSEHADQLTAKDELRLELETKLEELRSVIKNMELKKSDLEKAKLEDEKKVKSLENELDDLDDEYSQHKNNYADLQADFRTQKAKISNLEQLFSAKQPQAMDEMRSELETKLEDLRTVIKDMELKKSELEKAKSEEEEKVKSLENELDDVDEEYSQHKNNYADLQADFRKQEAKISNLEKLLSKQNSTLEKLKATIEQQNEKNKVLRALLDERNQRALNHEDKYSTILAQAQNLEKANSLLDEAVGKRNEELQQLRTAFSKQKNEFETQISDMKEQFCKENVSQATQEQLKQLESTVKQKRREMALLQQRLEQSQQEKDELLTEYQSVSESAASEINFLKAQVESSESELEGVKASSSTPSDVTRLQEEKDEIQSHLERANENIQMKTTEGKKLATLFDRMQQTCSELEDAFQEEKAQHQQAKKLLQEAQSNQANVEELQKPNMSIEQVKKSHKQQIAEKNLRINQLETDLIRGTDPLEDKIRSLRSEVSYQQNKAQQYMKELEKLRGQNSQQRQQGSGSASSTRPAVDRVPEATDSSGIIESCAMFAIKAENHKLTKALEKTKRELESKDFKYHDELSKKTQAEQGAQYWKDKARVMASQLKRFQSTQATSSSGVASPLKEQNTNTAIPFKRMRTGEPASQVKYTEKIPGLNQAKPIEGTATAVAARDAEEEGKDEVGKQCATQ